MTTTKKNTTTTAATKSKTGKATTKPTAKRVPNPTGKGIPAVDAALMPYDSSINAVVYTLRNWERVDLHDPDAVAQRLNDYFVICNENKIKPGVAGMAMALDMQRNRLYDLINGTLRFTDTGRYANLPNETRVVVKRAYESLEVIWEYSMQSGGINPVSGIFLGRNHFGYRNDVEYTITPKLETEKLEPQQLQKQLEALPDDD